MFGRNRNSEAAQGNLDGAGVPDGGSHEDILSETVDSYSRLDEGAYLRTETRRSGSVFFFREGGTPHNRNFVTVQEGVVHLFTVGNEPDISGRPRQGLRHYTISDETGEHKVTSSKFIPASEAYGAGFDIPAGGCVKIFESDHDLNVTQIDDESMVAELNGRMKQMAPEQTAEMWMVGAVLHEVQPYLPQTSHLRAA